jgi:hypothetical protein
MFDQKMCNYGRMTKICVYMGQNIIVGGGGVHALDRKNVRRVCGDE